MTSPTLALQAGQGGVTQVPGDVTPTRMAAPHANAAHAFFNVLRDVLHKVTFHNESELLDALNAVAAYEAKVVTNGDLAQVSTQNDRAAYEDVSKRVPPGGGLPQPLLTPAPIDYQQLAAALAPLLAAQAAAVQPQPVPAQPPAPPVQAQ